MEAAAGVGQLQVQGCHQPPEAEEGGTGSPHDLPDDTLTLALEMDLKLGVSGMI